MSRAHGSSLRLGLVLVPMVLSWLGCNCTEPAGAWSAPDAGTPDDGGTGPDAGAVDAGSADGGTVDAGSRDGGGTDGGGTPGVTSCAFRCHGDEATAAPPWDLAARELTTGRGVGAHRSHLDAGADWHRQVVCEDCHQVPVTVGDPGHLDTPLPAELTWGLLAAADGVVAGWDGAACDVYCHGPTLLPGGTLTRPEWTVVDGSQAACGTCHGTPPDAPHTSLTDCQLCHFEVMATATTFLAPQLHIDGAVQVQPLHPLGWSDAAQHGTTANAEGFAECQSCHGPTLTGGDVGISCESCHPGWQDDCTFCHGGLDNQTGAPPEGVDGETALTDLAVGGHTSHVEDTAIHLAWECGKCHVEPTSALDAGHVDGDGRAEVTFDSFNPAASYAEATGGCSSLYCHGNGRGNNGSEDWDSAPTLTCASCHDDETVSWGSQTMSGEHEWHLLEEGVGCWECHGDVVDSGKNIVDRSLHVDGKPDVSEPSWNPGGDGGRGTCNPACHGSERWN